jgi:hypothetical protein
VLSGKLTRDAVWKALKQRHFYATTGARIFLDVRAGAATMGDVVRMAEPPDFAIRVAGTAPIERIELFNGLERIKTFLPGEGDVPSRRIKIMWEGARFRGRERAADWTGSLRIRGNRIRRFDTVNFENPSHACRRTAPNALRWNSVTTGGWAGVIVELEHADRGTLQVCTAQADMTAPVKSLTSRPRAVSAGGVGLKLQAYRLLGRNKAREMTIPCYRPRSLHPGDNPFYVHVVQEDGQRAWSSPIYVVRS